MRPDFVFLKNKATTDVALFGFIAYICGSCLGMLKSLVDAVASAVLYEIRTRLVKAERNACPDTLLTNIKYPIEPALAREFAALAANGNLLYAIIKIGREVYLLKQWLADDDLVLYRGTHIYRKPLVGSFLIFTGTADGHIIPPISPIARKMLRKPLDPFSYHKEVEVAPLPYHIPRLLTPAVRLIEQKIAREAGIDGRAVGDLVISAPIPLDGGVK